MKKPALPLLPALASLLLLTGCSEEALANVVGGAVVVYIVGAILLFLLVIYALYDLWTNSADSPKKLLWTIIILIVPVIGAIAYFAIGRGSKSVV